MQARVLIVDDNPVVRRALRHLLECDGAWEISEAEDGQAGIQRALELHPHVIVLDLVMPVMDGLKAAQKISQALPDTAIVMYTMHGSPLLEVEAQKRGVRKLVSKLHSNILLSTIKELIAALPPEASSSPEPVPPAILATDPTAIPAPEQSSESKAPEIPKPSDRKLAS